MKLLRYMLAVAVSVVAAVVFTVSASAQTADFMLSVIPFDDESTIINWWYSFPEDQYYLFLPAGTDPSALRVTYSCNALKINGKKVKNGKKTRLFVPDESLTVECDGKSYTLTVLVSESLPAVFLHTDSGSLNAILADKSYKEKGKITIEENGNVTVSSAALEYIKGRGNYTWAADTEKKPYNIKFEEKIPLFGMGAAKKWSLLANALDATLLRNTSALSLAKQFGVQYAVGSQTIDLYINGEYQGNYLLCESVQIDAQRIDICNLEKQNEEANPSVSLDTLPVVCSSEDPLMPDSKKWVELQHEPENLTGGYLLEFDFPERYAQERCGFISKRGQCVVLKSPKNASQAQVEYIASLYQEMEDAVCSENGRNAAGGYFSDYIDIDSFVSVYLLLEYSMNIDSCSSSFFLTKNVDENRFVAGPAWDFDLAFRNYLREILDRTLIPDMWIVRENSLIAEESRSEENLLVALCRHELFWQTVTKKWNALYEELEKDFPATVIEMFEKNAVSASLNGVRWNILEGKTAEEKRRSYLQRGVVFVGLIQTRISALESGFLMPDEMKTFDDIAFSSVVQEKSIQIESGFQSPSVNSDAETEKTERLQEQGSLWHSQKISPVLLLLLIIAGGCIFILVVLFVLHGRIKRKKAGFGIQSQGADDI